MNLPALSFLALFLASPGAHADDYALIREGNAALAQKDYRTALPLFLVLARRGNPNAQFDVGAFYLNGQGVQKDEKQAFYWFEQSAALGNAHALQVLQDAAATGNEAAKNAYVRLVQSPTVNRTEAHEVKPGAGAATVAAHRGTAKAVDPPQTGFSLGISFGETGKVSGTDNSNSLGLLAGYKFTPSFGFELGYNELYRNANANGFAAIPGGAGRFSLNDVSFTGQYTAALGGNLSLLGNLGVHSSHYYIKGPAAARSAESNGWVAGLKVQYDVDTNVGLRAGFDTYGEHGYAERGELTGTLTEIALAVIFIF